MQKVLLIGEGLIRITPLESASLGDSVSSSIYYGGSEMNIACNLQAFGQATKVLTSLPNNPVGESFKAFLNSKGIDTSAIQDKGKRLGLYYMEDGFGCRRSQVYYDRENTSINEFDVRALDMDALFDDVALVHFSGITVAISQSVRDWLGLVLDEAKAREIPISFDLNWRSKMISASQAKTLFSQFAKYADYCFGIEPLMVDDTDRALFKREEASLEDVGQRMQQLQMVYGFKAIFHTMRHQDSQGRNVYHAYVQSDHFVQSVVLKTRVLQRVGSGDAFVAGAIYQLLQGKDFQSLVDFAVASATLKCTIAGDHMSQSVSQVACLLQDEQDVSR